MRATCPECKGTGEDITGNVLQSYYEDLKLKIQNLELKLQNDYSDEYNICLLCLGKGHINNEDIERISLDLKELLDTYSGDVDIVCQCGNDGLLLVDRQTLKDDRREMRNGSVNDREIEWLLLCNECNKLGKLRKFHRWSYSDRGGIKDTTSISTYGCVEEI